MGASALTRPLYGGFSDKPDHAVSPPIETASGTAVC
jgi:hypothetical protein